MEFVGSLIAVVSGGGAAAGAAGAAGAASAATAGSGLLSTLSAAGTVFSAVASIGAGAEAAAVERARAAEERFAARDEFIEGKETSAALKAELARVVANNQVAFAAGGVGLGSVSVEQARSQAVSDAERQLDRNQIDSASRGLARKRAARNAMARARTKMIGGFLSAGETLVGGAADLVELG